jgi:hypothetical protein
VDILAVGQFGSRHRNVAPPKNIVQPVVTSVRDLYYEPQPPVLEPAPEAAAAVASDAAAAVTEAPPAVRRVVPPLRAIFPDFSRAGVDFMKRFRPRRLEPWSQ